MTRCESSYSARGRCADGCRNEGFGPEHAPSHDGPQHWATLGVLGEILLWEDNRVELAQEKDQSGLPASVVDKFGRTHDIANLFVCDGSILPMQGSANPGLAIQALAARTADYLIKQGDAIFHSNRRDLNEPGIRYDLGPPYTRFKGNPRVAQSSYSFIGFPVPLHSQDRIPGNCRRRSIASGVSAGSSLRHLNSNWNVFRCFRASKRAEADLM